MGDDKTNVESGKLASLCIIYFFLMDGVLPSAEHRVSVFHGISPTTSGQASYSTTEWVVLFFNVVTFWPGILSQTSR